MYNNFLMEILDEVKDEVNEEFGKLNLSQIEMQHLSLIFPEGIIGVIIEVDLSKSKTDLLRNRLQKIAMKIQEKFSLDGFILTC